MSEYLYHHYEADDALCAAYDKALDRLRSQRASWKAFAEKHGDGTFYSTHRFFYGIANPQRPELWKKSPKAQGCFVPRKTSQAGRELDAEMQAFSRVPTADSITAGLFTGEVYDGHFDMGLAERGAGIVAATARLTRSAGKLVVSVPVRDEKNPPAPVRPLRRILESEYLEVQASLARAREQGAARQ